jgi:hypothetical protein
MAVAKEAAATALLVNEDFVLMTATTNAADARRRWAGMEPAKAASLV